MPKETERMLPEYEFKSGNLWDEIAGKLVENMDMQLPVRIINPILEKDTEIGFFYASIQQIDKDYFLELEFPNENFADAFVRSNKKIVKVKKGIYRLKIE